VWFEDFVGFGVQAEHWEHEQVEDEAKTEAGHNARKGPSGVFEDASVGERGS
jgi:hypothetical protein